MQRNQSLGDMTTLRLVQHNYTASLWEAGNTLILRANSLWNNIDRYDAARRELDVARQPDFLWIVSSHVSRAPALQQRTVAARRGCLQAPPGPRIHVAWARPHATHVTRVPAGIAGALPAHH